MDNRPTIAEVQEWVLRLYNTCEQTITDEERKEQHKYAIMVQRPQDKKFLVKMLDESSQIRDRKKLVRLLYFRRECTRQNWTDIQVYTSIRHHQMW